MQTSAPVHAREVSAQFNGSLTAPERKLASLALPANVGFGTAGEASRPGGDVFLYARDGSWTEVAGEPDRDGRHQVWSGGPSDLWAAVEDGYRTWQRLGEPSWERFGLTVQRSPSDTLARPPGRRPTLGAAHRNLATPS